MQFHLENNYVINFDRSVPDKSLPKTNSRPLLLCYVPYKWIFLNRTHDMNNIMLGLFSHLTCCTGEYIYIYIYIYIYMGLCVFSLPISLVMIERLYTLSYYHYQIGSMNHYPLFRIRSWYNGMRCMSLYILTMVLAYIYILIGHECSDKYIHRHEGSDWNNTATLFPLQWWRHCNEISNWMHLSVGQVDGKNHLSECTIHLSEIYNANATYARKRNMQSSVGEVLQVFHLSDCHFYSSQTIGRVKFWTLPAVS